MKRSRRGHLSDFGYSPETYNGDQNFIYKAPKVRMRSGAKGTGKLKELINSRARMEVLRVFMKNPINLLHPYAKKVVSNPLCWNAGRLHMEKFASGL